MTQPTIVVSKNVTLGNHLPFVLMAGPCVIESRDHAFFMAQNLKEITSALNIPFIFKSSYDKANRTSVQGKRGLGIDEGLRILSDIRDAFDVPVVSDVHDVEQCKVAGEVLDVIQIPAFLCRQTDLLLAAGNTGKVINVKKGQFLAPWDMINVIQKVTSTGNNKVLACERGTSFGYNTLITDMRGIAHLTDANIPVIFDATHSVQQPGGAGGSTAGERHYVPVLARAAVAVGVAGVFMEVHDNPEQAPSDGPNMVRLKSLSAILKNLKDFDDLSKAQPIALNAYR